MMCGYGDPMKTIHVNVTDAARTAFDIWAEDTGCTLGAGIEAIACELEEGTLDPGTKARIEGRARKISAERRRRTR